MKDQLASTSYPFLTDLQLKLIQYQSTMGESKSSKIPIKTNKELIISLLNEDAKIEDFEEIKQDFSMVRSRLCRQ